MMIALLTIGLIAIAIKTNRSVNGVGSSRRWYGGNSGYQGYSMSNRAVEAREEGRFPKTDFKRVYGMTDRELRVLVDLGAISDKEWHHTSKFGNKTTFYGWDDLYDEYINLWNDQRGFIKKLIKENDFQALADLFDLEYKPYNTDLVKTGDKLVPKYDWWGFGELIDAQVTDVFPNHITYNVTVKLKNGETMDTSNTIDRYGFGVNWEFL